MKARTNASAATAPAMIAVPIAVSFASRRRSSITAAPPTRLLTTAIMLAVVPRKASTRPSASAGGFASGQRPFSAANSRSASAPNFR